MEKIEKEVASEICNEVTNDVAGNAANNDVIDAANDAKKPFYKKWWFWVIIVVIVILSAIFGSSGSEDESNDSSSETNTESVTETHIYDDAEIKEIMNGSRTEKLGEYSLISVSSDEVTDDALTDWYFNYVEENDYNWCMILYTDKDNNMGVYATSGSVEKDVYFEQNDYGDYSLSDSSESIMYSPTKDGTLEIITYE